MTRGLSPVIELKSVTGNVIKSPSVVTPLLVVACLIYIFTDDTVWSSDMSPASFTERPYVLTELLIAVERGLLKIRTGAWLSMSKLREDVPELCELASYAIALISYVPSGKGYSPVVPSCVFNASRYHDLPVESIVAL